MEDMKDDVLITQCRNRFRDDNQFNYCRVQVTNESIDKIDKVSLFFSGRKVDTNLATLTGSEIYLILGGGVRVIRDRKYINTNWIEIDWNRLLHDIDKLSYNLG